MSVRRRPDGGRGRAPFLYLSLDVVAGARGAVHDAFDVPFHALLVEAIQLEAIRGRRPRGACSWYLLDGVEGVYEDSICSICGGH
jgi:hypothetical protein